jgi:hypothetical protein
LLHDPTFDKTLLEDVSKNEYKHKKQARYEQGKVNADSRSDRVASCDWYVRVRERICLVIKDLHVSHAPVSEEHHE